MELLNVYDDKGNILDKKVIRGEYDKLNDHEHIAVSIIFIENDKREFLIQKTSIEKGGYYSSTGGHVCNGETPLQTIKREVYEELGVNIDNDNILELGCFLYDKILIYLYYLKKNIDINNIKLQKEEVESVKYLNINEINKLIDNKLMLESHGKMFKKVLKKYKYM